jgi:phage protein D
MKPEFDVHLDGNRLQGEEKGAISAVRVYLTHGGASAFELVVDDPDLRWQAKPTFTDSKEVKIDFGVPGKMKKVFDGEVTAWRTELERAGPTVLIVRGLDRSHRLMRGHKTKAYTQASPIDCAQQIASAAGFTAKTAAGSLPPVKTFRLQANESDFGFLRRLAELEGYLFYVEGTELHFERPTISSQDDVTVTFGEDLKTFLPVANFRRPASQVEVGAWDSAGKSGLKGVAKPGDELWSIPGGKSGGTLARFQSTQPKIGIVDAQVSSQDHADTIAKAALTRRNLQFLTAEVEVQGNPDIRPGAMVSVKDVGVYSGRYLVTEANHFYDAGGYHCIFYVASDKFGTPSTQGPKLQTKTVTPQDGVVDIRLVDDAGKPIPGERYEVTLPDGTTIDGAVDDAGRARLEGLPRGNYKVTFPRLSSDAWDKA